MAVRQYIGARYTIKVYENSDDPSSAEWESGQAYEPITLVTYLNSSYLSKKQVPQNVGNPADNPQYWVVTGFYNGQIASLQQQIDDMKDSTVSGSLQYQINELDTKLTNDIDQFKSISVTPEMFGAVGDGVTDDTAAMQDTIDSGFPIVLTGTYNLTDSLVLPSDCMIIGKGGKITASGVVPVLKLYDVSHILIDHVYFESGSQILHANNVDDLKVEGCYFKSCGYVLLTSQGKYLKNAIIKDCIIEDSIHDFVELNSVTVACENISILNNNYLGSHSYPSSQTENRFMGITNAKNVLISGNKITNVNGDSMIHIEDVGCDELIINDNFFGECNGTADIFATVSSGNTSNITFSNNVFEKSSFSSSYRTFNIGSNGVVGINMNVDNNIFINTYVSIGYNQTLTFKNNIMIDSVYRCIHKDIVIGNTFTVSDSSLIPIYNTSDAENCIIKDNIINGSNSDSIKITRPSAGNYCPKVIIMNNRANGSISIQNAKQCLVKNNYVTSGTVELVTVDHAPVDSVCEDNYLNGVLIS